MKGAFKTLTIMAALLLIPPAIAQQSSNVLQTMKSTVIPASDAVFAVGNSAPKTPQEWSAVGEWRREIDRRGKITHSSGARSSWRQLGEILESNVGCGRDGTQGSAGKER